ncbi:MAG: TetR/AcrR family transcriptional regulator [Blastocatellia bacterium]|nr:TetR/AcrR family transcriptional regulator [Blastocatellia bacterium]
MAREQLTTAETRAHILDIARKQFFKRGYSGVSINEIVEALNVTKPTVYYHFKNKAGLFAALVEDAYSCCFEQRKRAVDEQSPAAEQVFQVIAADFAFCLAHPDLVRFVLALTFALPEERPVDVREFHKRDYEFFLKIVERGIERGEFHCIDATEAAITLQGLIAINIMSFLQMDQTPEFLSSERARLLSRVLLNGIEKKPENTK